MKIALTSFTFWPYARMGQRYVHDLACYLSKNGFRVDIITSKPGNSTSKIKNDVRIIYHAQKTIPSLLCTNAFHLYALNCFKSLLKRDYDVVQSLAYYDAFGVALSQKFHKNRPFFYLISNCEPFFWGGWRDKRMFETAIRHAKILSPSRYLNSCLKERYNMEGEIVHPGVNTSYFRPVKQKRLDPPKILCMSALINIDKRIDLLLKAFALLKKCIPEAVLQLSGHVNERIIRDLLSVIDRRTRASIQFLGVGREEDVPSLYANATITVLPGINQSFGMPIIESLASGTPVVGARSGGIPEIIDNCEIGYLFGGNGISEKEALCHSMMKAIQLAHDPATSERCRQHALRYDWDTIIGPKIIQMYNKFG
jgi:phosphatidylinositol alpha-mannosyltransferase